MHDGAVTGDREVPLAGGVANAGAVVRVGDTVRRPRRSTSEAVGSLLQHLAASGADVAPRFLGFDDQGREVLSWIPGEVPVPPFPAWATSDAALASVARLLRAYHGAVAGFWAPGAADVWSRELADPGPPELVCHDDVCPENVVFRDGEAVALLDFDFAAPGRRLWDVVATASMWVPLEHPAWRRAHPSGLDASARAAVFADAYGLDAGERAELVDVLVQRHAVGRAFVRRRLAAGEPAFERMAADFGAAARWVATDRWLEEERPRLERALCRPTGGP